MWTGKFETYYLLHTETGKLETIYSLLHTGVDFHMQKLGTAHEQTYVIYTAFRSVLL